MENKRIKKLKLGIDLDDVVFDFAKVLLICLKDKYNINCSLENLTSYDFPSFFNIDLENVLSLIKKIDNEKLELCFGAKESIFILSSNFEIYFITSRIFRKGTLESLNKYFNDIFFNLVFSSNPYAETPGKTKGEICNELGINFMIEDCIKHSKNCADKGIKTFLINKPWNQNFEHKNVVRVDGWSEIVNKLN